MPRYDYKCESCGEIYQLVHSIKEKETDCIKCETEDCLIRLPSILTVKIKKQPKEKEAGHLVKQHIEEAKEEIKEYKKEMRKEFEK